MKSIIASLRRFERHLSPKDTWVPKVRGIALRGAEKLLGHATDYPFTTQKWYREYLTTVEVPLHTLEIALHDHGYQRNILASKKYRMVDGEKQWEVASWVDDPPETEWQHHVYVFDSGESLDIYAHREKSVRRPKEHLNGAKYQEDAVPGGVFDALDAMDITYYERNH
jgi:hypothetical protein